ncbi:MAG: hypothetical protein GY830_07705 [Bacteroidetes bacterium]|nr:hypothetical protein [Bacteroidota bacterium]
MNKPNIEWHTEQRKVNDLIADPKNPRILTDKQKQHLTESIEKFNIAEIPAINTDNMILAGHQRCMVLKLIDRGEETIDVRVPNRKLTKSEAKEYQRRSNLNTGVWDYEMLGEDSEEFLKEIGFDTDDLKKIFRQFEDNLENKELDINDIEEDLTIECPKCKFKFSQ